jgi:hypothetical protein
MLERRHHVRLEVIPAKAELLLITVSLGHFDSTEGGLAAKKNT